MRLSRAGSSRGEAFTLVQANSEYPIVKGPGISLDSLPPGEGGGLGAGPQGKWCNAVIQLKSRSSACLFNREHPSFYRPLLL
ncbi:hypothetical protein Dred_1012 [Desulforamulus reducens MI-1]|uniref:Uncharacterized protein n=1 Tax=Desulforamulus reducens (strain ATCC BAA-1160 / DSM 100696 / MI-1) TaxID=349161 RepID=A4J394_DESRM|nr:hypothetical protein Dred_1012 [Desulforamulus reducens MI-1]